MKITISLIINFVMLVAILVLAGMKAEEPTVEYVEILHFVERPVPVRIIEVITLEALVKIVEVEKIVEKIVEVERIITENVTVDIRDFESPEELLAWLEVDDLDTLPYIKDLFECENFADALQRRAKEDGYTIDRQYDSKGTKLPGSDIVLVAAHAMNSTVIGNEVWLIDAMTDKAWVAYVREG